MLLSDTVGFVRRLPHQLVEAFRSTLEEVVDADLLVHLVDAERARRRGRIDAVRAVLREIGAVEVPELLVFNKSTSWTARDARACISHRIPGSLGGLGADRRRGGRARRP